jgi:rhodanese-related sulfurtransferase
MKSFTLMYAMNSIFASDPADTPADKEDMVQDSERAERYFIDQLAFNINPSSLKKSIDSKDKITIIDVRAEKDFKEGHIPGAKNVPYDKHKDFSGDESEFAELSKDNINVIYCYSEDCTLAEKAAKTFASLKYPVKLLKGGIKSWTERKYNTEK